MWMSFQEPLIVIWANNMRDLLSLLSNHKNCQIFCLPPESVNSFIAFTEAELWLRGALWVSGYEQWHLELWEIKSRKRGNCCFATLFSDTNLLCSNFPFSSWRTKFSFPSSLLFVLAVTWLLLTKWLECSQLKKLSNNCKFPWRFFD